MFLLFVVERIESGPVLTEFTLFKSSLSFSCFSISVLPRLPGEMKSPMSVDVTPSLRYSSVGTKTWVQSRVESREDGTHCADSTPVVSRVPHPVYPSRGLCRTTQSLLKGLLHRLGPTSKKSRISLFGTRTTTGPVDPELLRRP